MYTKYILVLFIIFSVNAQSQAQRDNAKLMVLDLEMQDQFKDETGSQIDLKKVKGSPYESDHFVQGTVSSKTIDNTQRSFFRYNVYDDIIEMKTNLNGEEILGLIKSLNIYATISNKEYHFEIYSNGPNKGSDEGYFILISENNNVNLYLKKVKIFHRAKEAADSFRDAVPAEFTDSKTYYYKINKKRVLFPISTNKKKFLDQFSEHQDELKKFMKTEKINLKNEKDLIELIQYYDSLIK